MPKPEEEVRRKRPKSDEQKKVNKKEKELRQARIFLGSGKISKEEFDTISNEYKNYITETKRENNNKRQSNRYKKDPAFRAIKNCRSRLIDFLKNHIKYSKSLGCSHEEFRTHLESLFKPGMTWENYGKWEIDHIKPLMLAFMEGSESFSKACNYMNLQPLWHDDHNIKTAEDVRIIRLNK